MARTRATQRPPGFSLVEVLVAIALSAIALGATVPVASNLIDHYRLEGATRTLAFEIARAHMQAVGQNQAVRLVAVGDSRYRRQRSADGVTYSDSGGDTQLPTGVVLATGDTGMPRFDRQGLAPATTVVTLRGQAGGRTLTTNVVGKVTVQ